MNKKIMTLILAASITACGGGGDGGGGDSEPDLPEVSSPAYDYRNYASENPEITTVDGFWLVFARYYHRSESKTATGSGYVVSSYIEGYYERTKLISISDIGNGEYRIQDPSWVNYNNQLNSVVPWIDPNINNGISWGEEWLGHYTLHFEGTTEMEGEITQFNPDSIGHGWAGEIYDHEVYAIKLADFPSPDTALDGLEEPIWGTIYSEGWEYWNGYWNASGNVTNFDRVRFRGEYMQNYGESIEPLNKDIFVVYAQKPGGAVFTEFQLFPDSGNCYIYTVNIDRGGDALELNVNRGIILADSGSFYANIVLDDLDGFSIDYIAEGETFDTYFDVIGNFGIDLSDYVVKPIEGQL